MKPQQLNAEQAQAIRELNAQHPSPWTPGTWYPGTLAGKPVEIRRTRSAGRPYLKIRKMVTVNLCNPDGSILEKNYRQDWNYFTVNLREFTMTDQGF